MKKFILTSLLLLFVLATNAQTRYISRNAIVYFISEASQEKIEATNSLGATIIDATSGLMEFMVTMKGFEFEKALMQEHFNENYVESDQFPKAVFKGAIQDISKIIFTKDGLYPFVVKGKMTMHGVTKDIMTDGTIEVKGGKITGKTRFNLNIEEYNIEIPSVVKNKVSKDVRIDVSAPYTKL